MAFTTNSRGEKILSERLSEIVSNDEIITVKSEEGHTCSVSRFLFNFFSDFILPREVDLVLTQLSTDNTISGLNNSISGPGGCKDSFLLF